MEENGNEEYETGYVQATIRHQSFHQSNDWYVVRVLVDNCADEHVCSPRDFEWIAIEPSKKPNLVSASGHKLKHYGQQAVPMKPHATRLNDNSIREDSTHVLPKPNLARWRGSCVQTTGSTGQQTRISMARRHLAQT